MLGKRELAELVGVKAPTLQHWIDGRIKHILARNAVALCKILGVRMEWLLDGIEPMSAPDADQLTLPHNARWHTAKRIEAKNLAAETASEIANIVKAALPVRQTAMEAACRFIVAADLDALPMIVNSVKEIASTGTLKSREITDEEMAWVMQLRTMNRDEREGIFTLIDSSRLGLEKIGRSNG